MRKRLKFFALLIAAVMLFNLFPSLAFAEELDRLKTIDAPSVQEQIKQEAKIVTELTDKRERNVKQFLLDDNKQMAAIYPVPVHYLNNSTWKDIDNSLIDALDEDNNNILENKANDYKVKISKHAKSDKLVRIQKDKYEISWGIDNLNDSSLNVVPKDMNKLNSLSDNDKKTALPNITSEVEFKNIYQNVDLKYNINPSEVKENIVLNSKIDNPVFAFNIKVKNLSARLNDDKSVSFFDDKNSKAEIFRINAPYMFDAAGSESSNIDVALENVKDGYVLTLKPSTEWISSKDRVYPITIDPQVSTSLDSNSIFDAHVSSSYPTTNCRTSSILKTGVGSLSGTNRTCIKFDLPDLTPADLITKATFSALAINHSGSAASQVNVHEVLSDWDSSTINWNNKPSYNTKIEDYKLVQSSAWYQWDITNIAKKWYSTGNNYGLMLKDLNETTNYDEYYSSDTGTESYRPQVVLYYVNNSGLESYWSYHSQDVRRAGTGYINDYNGNLIFVHDDLSMSGSRMPIDLNHVFNSNNRTVSYGYGLGWRINLYQEIAYISGSNQYTYIDGDGTKHYFSYNNDPQNPAYNDESGLDLTLKKNADNTYTITDKKDNILNFTTSGYLSSMADSNGDTLSLTYTNGKISKVTDGADRITTLELSPSNYLTGIVDPAGRRTSFQYTGTLLTTITYPDGKTTTYNYDGNNNLTSVINHDGYKVTYTYYSVKPYRVMKAEEGNTDGTVGNSLNISYGFNATTFTDARGNKNIYQFNDNGNTMNIRDGDGYAEYYKYIESGGNVNKLTSESKLQKTTVNYILNHNAEITSSWGAVNDANSTGTTSYTASDKYLGNQSLMVTKTNNTGRQSYTQYVTLEKGKTYTLSGYVKTSNVSSSNNKGAAIFASYQDSTGTWQSVYSKYVSGTNGWQRLEATFTLPADAASATVYARGGIVEETGTAYFDCFQLEDGKIANRYNIVENADFKFSSGGVPSLWTKNTYTDANDTVVAGIANDPGVPNIDRNAFKIIGSATKSKNIYQKINVSGKVTDVYSIGGWARRDSVPTGSGRYFAIDIAFESKANPGTFDYHVINFNEDSSSWQYAADRIIPAFDYSNIYVYFLYYNNANTAYFDGMQLYKEEFSTSYTHDDAGNVVKISDLADKESTFEYTNNDLEKLTDPNGGVFNYVYDGKHNLTSATTAANVVYSFTYDSYGNPLTATIKDHLTNPTISLTTSAYYTDGTPQDTSYNYLKKLVDPSGNTVLYGYDEQKGILNNVTDPKGKVTTYSYDGLDRLTEVKKNVDGSDITNTYTYENDRIKTIAHNGFNYGFNYDSLGNVLSITTGPWNLITNNYEELSINGTTVHTGRLLTSTYGNNQTVGFSYDNLGRVIAKTFNGQDRFRYQYDCSGNLGYQEDLVNNVSYRYIYDLADRLSEIVDSNGNSLKYGFDNNNNVQSIAEIISGNSYVTGYTYDGDNKVKEINISGGSKITYAYDKIGRVDTVTITSGTSNSITDYSYSPTGKLESVTLPGGRIISYTYDANGNIETVTDSGKVIKYYYNEVNELKREDNGVIGKTIVYAYDGGGNITSKTEYNLTSDPNPQNPTKTYDYSYGDAGWKDKLTAYDGKAITYDNIGNPLTYDGFTYEWEEGRQLKSISKTGFDVSFMYNDSGIRTQKTVNGVTTEYHLALDKVTYEKTGNDKIYYSYSNTGNLVSMKLNGVEYFYIRNAQGDIVGLLDGTGTQVVSYTYDTWGKLISITGSLKDTVGVKNPYRYKGYRYDTETGLYYLQSRYYNPEWGRYINADALIGQTGELLGHNLFAYCKNNPANAFDPSGFREIRGAIRIDGDFDGVDLVPTPASTKGNSILPNKNQLKGVAKGAATSGIEGGISPTLKDVPDYLAISNRAMRRAGDEFLIPVKGASIARGIGKLERYGAVGIALTGFSVWDNYHSGYSKSEAFGRSIIDVGVSAALIGIGLFTPVGWTVAISFGVGIGAEVAKNYIWKKE